MKKRDWRGMDSIDILDSMEEAVKALQSRRLSEPEVWYALDLAKGIIEMAKMNYMSLVWKEDAKDDGQRL
jgi:hypothetical protein